MFLQYRELNPQQINQLNQQLQQASNLIKSINYNISQIKSKTIDSLKTNLTLQQNLRTLHNYFTQWVIITKQKKVNNFLNKNSFFHKLSTNLKINKQKSLHKLNKQISDNFYEKRLKKKYFEILFRQKSDHQKIKKIVRNRISRYWEIMATNIKIKQSNRQSHQIIWGIYADTLLKRYFARWEIYSKMQKIYQFKRKTNLKILIPKIKQEISQQNNIPRKYYQYKLLKLSFMKLLLNKKLKKAQKFHKKYILNKSFKKWYKSLGQLYYERESELTQQQIIMDYQKRKNRIKLMYFFQKWANHTTQNIQNRHKNRIAKQYAVLKQKQVLLKRSFEGLKQIKYYNIADKYYQMKIKQKTLQSLKIICVQSMKKWDKVYHFVQKREKRKYFNAFKSFVKTEQKKLQCFRQRKYFRLLCITIVKQYLRKNRLAEQYYCKSLQYRTLVGLKKQVDLNNRYKQLLVYINAVLPLKRWRKNHKIKQYLETKAYFIKKKVFSHLKLVSYLHQQTQKKPKKVLSEFQQNQTLLKFSKKQISPYQQPDTIEFEKVILQSPQKMFSIDLSYSAYNLNDNVLF